MKIINLVLTISTIAGVIWQCSVVLREYFLYTSVTRVAYSRNAKEPAAISICHFQHDLIPENMTLNTSTVDEINQHSVKLSDLITCQTNEYVFDTKIFYRNYVAEQCVRVQFINQNMSRKRVVGLSFNYFPIINNSNYDEFSTWFSVLLHPLHSFPHDIDAMAIYLVYSNQPNDFNSFDFSFDLVTSRHLKEPFAARCRIYKDYGFTSRGDCISKCKQRYFISNYNQAGNPCDEDLITDKYDRKLDGEEIFKDKCLLAEDFCMAQCTLNCTTNIMFPIMNDKWLFKYGDSYIDVYVTRPHIIVVSEPFLNLSDLMIYSASIIGIWTGMNALTASMKIVGVIEHVKIKYLSKPKNVSISSSEPKLIIKSQNRSRNSNNRQTWNMNSTPDRLSESIVRDIIENRRQILNLKRVINLIVTDIVQT